MSTASEHHPDAPLRAALRYGIAGLIVLVIVSAVLGSIFAGLPGLWGSLIGSAIGGFFILATAALVLFSAKLDSGIQGMVMLASWVGKLLVVLIVVAVLKQFDFYSRGTLFLTVVAALLIVLGAETYGLLRQRVPIVTTPDERSDQDRSNV
ncbi:hypothetical protein [Nocardia terpenica]|uniref:ATP synthase protein I n=1 Tax=Nocardia terpenica TaxID=455432 RepID=A0A291RFC1_9NOCA|nr:hypothetical protein [Nocardia terpenica]ATL66009.1 hypothetical protein CRH09_07080 [Nocardia terpenica]